MEPKKKKEVKSKKKTKNSLVIVHEESTEPELNENKYSEKLKSLINKKKSQTSTKSDVKIRFGWKY